MRGSPSSLTYTEHSPQSCWEQLGPEAFLCRIQCPPWPEPWGGQGWFVQQGRCDPARAVLPLCLSSPSDILSSGRAGPFIPGPPAHPDRPRVGGTRSCAGGKVLACLTWVLRLPLDGEWDNTLCLPGAVPCSCFPQPEQGPPLPPGRVCSGPSCRTGYSHMCGSSGREGSAGFGRLVLLMSVCFPSPDLSGRTRTAAPGSCPSYMRNQLPAGPGDAFPAAVGTNGQGSLSPFFRANTIFLPVSMALGSQEQPWCWQETPAPRGLHWGSPEFPRPSLRSVPHSRVLSWKRLRIPPAAERDPGSPSPSWSCSRAGFASTGWAETASVLPGHSGAAGTPPGPEAPALPGLAAPPCGGSGSRSVPG